MCTGSSPVRGAFLQDANLTEAAAKIQSPPLKFRARRNERGANLKDAIAIVRTEWPEGFDPEAAGVIFED